MIKNTVAKRSKRTNNLSKLADIKMDLTGTPITRNIEDLYQPFHSLDPRILGYHNRFAFAKAHLVYSDKYPGLVKRTQNVEYITARIEPFVYEYFPPEDCTDSWQTITSPLSERQHYWYGEVKSAILARIAQCDHATSDIYVLFTALQSIVSGFISSRVLNRALGTKGKYPDGITFQSSKLESLLDLRASIDGPVVVWCSRLHEVDTLRQSLPESYVVTGAYTPDERHKTVQSFRASLCGTLIATTQVARRGIDLYESSTAVFYGHSFDWEAREQAAARIKAPGIKDEPCAYFDLVIRQSLDERVMESYSRKEHIVGQFVQMLRQDKEAALKALEAL